jgi:2-isopropylmalate synthase
LCRRERLDERTFESLVGARKVIIHLYNSTSPAQRRVVFGMSKEQIIEVARRGAKWIKDRLPRLKGTEVMLQYSPESFSATEVEFREKSEAVMDGGSDARTEDDLNLLIRKSPANVRIEISGFAEHQEQGSLIISLHTLNRSTGVPATNSDYWRR